VISDYPRAQGGQDCHVVVELIDDQDRAERMEFDLVADQSADFANGRIGVNTPLGKTIRGKFAGAVVSYVQGDICKVRILSATPLQNKADDDAAARRQAILDEARRKAERTNTDMFASSYSGKWGDYSTDEMEYNGDDDTDADAK
jgi:hypothetical protein